MRRLTGCKSGSQTKQADTTEYPRHDVGRLGGFRCCLRGQMLNVISNRTADLLLLGLYRVHLRLHLRQDVGDLRR
jgi:hypothetical protein